MKVKILFFYILVVSFFVFLSIPSWSEDTNDLDIMKYGSESLYAYTYYVPFFINSESKGAWTGLGLRNLGDIIASVKIECYSYSGLLIETLYKYIPYQGHDSFFVGKTNSYARGWVKIASDQKLAGLSFYSPDGVYMADMDVKSPAELSKNLITPHFHQDNEWDTTIYFFNPNNMYETSITMTKISNDGSIMGRKTLNLAPLCSGSCTLSEFGGTGTGSVEISADRDIAGFTLFDNIKTGQHFFAGLSASANGN